MANKDWYQNAWRNTTGRTYTLIGAQRSAIADIPPGFALVMNDDWPQVVPIGDEIADATISIRGAEWNYGATTPDGEMV